MKGARVDSKFRVSVRSLTLNFISNFKIPTESSNLQTCFQSDIVNSRFMPDQFISSK